ncbi:GvpL/GvpF family gas vesicle protein [Kitasatospora sp. DSM 101779]|uniref:GvpL/GvpF family gas vesicle protein n=1 Tax=Kitasatospora sp. DSM 101779 TaxID=2853165 RepID=UPI0021D83A53|nr:GvpL/GvpF family gas vesicle protein [Kitasatospora sp. DSM 101779]MCU7826300.1 GvpL/GvpF family gas vesicle protein [Kitasatospora sp. DSM 101779]
MTTPDLTWLYAVARDVEDGALDGLTGVADEPLRTLTVTGLALVVGSVPRSGFDERALQRRLADLQWLEAAVRAHHRVIAELARTGRTLPLRFATLYRDDRGAAAFLRGAGPRLRAALERVADRAEWGVKAYLAGAAPAPADIAAPADRPGTAYLLRRRAQRDALAQRFDEAMAAAREIHAALAALADRAAEHPLQSAEASGRAEPMLLNGAYLVDRERVADFGAAATELGRRFSGVRLELTGPWPPYSFADIGPEVPETVDPAGTGTAETAEADVEADVEAEAGFGADAGPDAATGAAPRIKPPEPRSPEQPAAAEGG